MYIYIYKERARKLDSFSGEVANEIDSDRRPSYGITFIFGLMSPRVMA